MIVVGKAAKTDPAMGRFQETAWPPARLARATVMGWAPGLVRVTAKRNSFQIWVNCQIPTTKKGAPERGIIR